MNEQDIFMLNEHHEALKILYDKKIKQSLIFHFDFHIDIAYSTLENVNAVYGDFASSKTVYDVSEKVWYNNKYSTGLHCGNFFYYALKYGMIGHYVWIMQDEKRPFEKVFYKVIQEVGGVTKEEILNLKKTKNFITGKLFGIDFTVTTINNFKEALSTISNEYNDIILDIDIDVLFDIYTKLPIMKVNDFFEHIKYLSDKSTMAFICDSINSGHTPRKFEFVKFYLKGLLAHQDINKYKMQEQYTWDYIQDKRLINALSLEESNDRIAILIINSMIQIDRSERACMLEVISNEYIKALIMYDQKEVALKYFRIASKKYNDMRFLECYVKCLISLRMYQEALTVIENIQKKLTWSLYYYQGICMLFLTDYHKAIECFYKAIGINPINQKMLQLLSLCNKKVEKYNDAEKIDKYLSIIDNKWR